MVYDTLLLGALWMGMTAVWIAVTREAVATGSLAFRLYLVAIALAFFGGFWVHGGRTLGMQAWRLRVVNHHGDTIDWLTALIRFAGCLLSWATLGVGFLWAVVDGEGRTLHDRLAGTRVVLMPRRT